MSPEEIQALPRPIHVVGFMRHAEMFGRHHGLKGMQDMRVINQPKGTWGISRDAKVLFLPGWLNLERDVRNIIYAECYERATCIDLDEQEAYGIKR